MTCPLLTIGKDLSLREHGVGEVLRKQAVHTMLMVL